MAVSFPANVQIAQVRAGGHSRHGHHKGNFALVADDDSCCPPVIDPLTLGAVLAGIAAATVGLRQVLISNITARKKRDTTVWEKLDELILGGKQIEWLVLVDQRDKESLLYSELYFVGLL